MPFNKNNNNKVTMVNIIVKKSIFRLGCCVFLCNLLFGIVGVSADNSGGMYSNQHIGLERQGTKIYKIDFKEASADRSFEKGMYQFQKKDGTYVFTNRPQKYRGSGEYKEVYFKKSRAVSGKGEGGGFGSSSLSDDDRGYAIIVPFERVHLPAKFEHSYKGKKYDFQMIKDIVRECAKYYSVDEKLIWAVMEVESGFNPNAVSNAGACGLMQLMPATAVEMGVDDIFDPAQNIAGGVQYLRKMLDLFNGNLDLALAGYNAGPENVKKYGGVPPFTETINYIKLVKSKLGLKVDESYYAKRFKGGFSTIKKDNAYIVSRLPKKYMVYFKSGLRQPADEVTEQAPYYYITYGSRTYPVRTELVAKVEKVS